MEGSQVRTAREEIGWSRQEFARRTDGVSVAQLAAIELGRRRPTETEADEIKRVLREQLHQTLAESGEHQVIEVAEVVEPDEPSPFSDLQKGDHVRVDGQRGVFKFQAFHPGEHPHVDVYGPPAKPKMRSVIPERIRRIGRRRR